MRKAAVKEWYGISCEEVTRYISHFNGILDENLSREIKEELFSLKPKALIVPHAGWVYSGFTANTAYRTAKNTNPSSIAVIGPSHKFAFEGISTTLENEYETPCGNLPVDILTAKELIENYGVLNLENVHTEHSTEVQMPFIQHYFKNIPVIELIYSDYSAQKLKEIILFLIKKNILVVISSDLSHYYDINTANTLDYNCLKAVNEQNTALLEKCEACGKTGIEALILAAKSLHLTSYVTDYRTSADISKDEKNVVGYMSAVTV